METLTGIPFEFDIPAIMERVHIEPDSDDAREFEKLAAGLKAVAAPKAVYRECFVESKGKDTVTIEGTTFTSRTLRRNLDRAERVFAYVVTCGREADSLPLPAGDMLVEFWHDNLKMALLMAARQHLSDHLKRRYRLGKTASMSPGSGDADTWPIQQQTELFALLGGTAAVWQRVGVELTDSFLMTPNKTVSGLWFPTESDFRSCQVCHRAECPSRGAPFDQKLWDSMQHD